MFEDFLFVVSGIESSDEHSLPDFECCGRGARSDDRLMQLPIISFKRIGKWISNAAKHLVPNLVAAFFIARNLAAAVMCGSAVHCWHFFLVDVQLSLAHLLYFRDFCRLTL